MSSVISRRTILGAGFLAGLGTMTGCAPEQTAYDPSGPGIVDVVIPYSTGGGTDTWGRFITPYFAERQKDVDRYQIENVPGGESITGTNAYVKAGVTNGKQVMVASATTYFQSMLGQSTVQFDFAKMDPLALNGTGAAVWTSPESGIKSVDDLVNNPQELRYGGMSASGLDLVALLAFEALGSNIRGVFGMEGRGPTRLAVQRGESDLDMQTTSSFLSQIQPLIDSGEAIPLFAIGALEDGKVVRDPNLPDIPTFSEVYKSLGSHNEHQRLAYEAFQSFVVPGFFYQKGLWSNQGTDEDVITTYDHLVSELNSDETFLEEAKDALGGYQLVSGADARDAFHDALQIDDDVLAYTKQILEQKYDAVLN